MPRALASQVYIKDIKSSNGTFINGDRLSPEAQESEVYELHSEDLVEFGIDIVGDDNKTIIHHKVACRVYLVITAEDALGMRNDFNSLYHGGHRVPLGHSGIGPGAEGGLRRGKHPGGLSFDHILSKLQSELAKSRETGSELGGLTTTFNGIHETLGGGLPPNPSAFQHMVPPLVSEASAAASREAAEDAKKQSAAVTALQTSLVETQASLAAHVDKIRTLESMLAEHEQLRQEVGLLKYQMEVAKQEVDAMMSSQKSSIRGGGSRATQEEDFDDGASVASVDTVTEETASRDVKPRAKREIKKEEDEGEADDDHEGPRAPPDLPPHLAAKGTEIVAVPATAVALEELSSKIEARNSAMEQRLEALETQLESALALSRDLKTQHSAAQETVKALESKVQSLGREVEEKVKQLETSVVAVHAIEGRWTAWREQIEEGWRKERKGWEEEREHIRAVVSAWDEANRKLEDEVARSRSNSGGGGGGNQGGGGGNNNNGKRRNNKNAKRRQGKRHVNRDLRALLYKPEFNREDGAASSDEEDEDAADHKSTTSSTMTTERSVASNSSGSGGGKAASAASTAATSPPMTASNASSGSEDGTRTVVPAGGRGGKKGAKGIAAQMKQASGALKEKGANAETFKFKDNVSRDSWDHGWVPVRTLRDRADVLTSFPFHFIPRRPRHTVRDDPRAGDLRRRPARRGGVGDGQEGEIMRPLPPSFPLPSIFSIPAQTYACNRSVSTAPFPPAGQSG